MPKAQALPDHSGLDEIDRRILRALAADGRLTNKAIAARLGGSLATVRDHLKHVFEKTGARSQVALVALIRGFIDRRH